MGTDGGSIEHAQEEPCAAEDARKIGRPSMPFFQTSQEGQVPAPAWETASLFYILPMAFTSHET